MTTEFSQFEHLMKQAHAQSLANVSPQTLQRLRSARHATTTRQAQARGFHWRWLLAGAVPAVAALGLGLQFLLPVSPPPGGQGQVAGNDGYIETLTESPELYLWLESNGPLLAME